MLLPRLIIQYRGRCLGLPMHMAIHSLKIGQPARVNQMQGESLKMRVTDIESFPFAIE